MLDVPAAESLADPQHGDAGGPLGREVDRVGEVDVEGHQGSARSDGGLQYVGVWGAGELLVVNRVDVVAGAL